MPHNTMNYNQSYLERPQLNNQIMQSLQNPLTAVIAGAGYGKTQSVYEFLQKYDAVTIWLQLSPLDNLPVRLWENFIYAVSLQNKSLSSSLVGLGFPDSMQEHDRFLSIFSTTLKHNKKYVLVYDDFHLIHDAHVLKFFERLIYAHIPNISIIILSRKNPGINGMGLFSEGGISVMNEDDLRFSRDEMTHCLKMQDVHLSTKAISDVYNYTEGWVFAVLLVGFSLKKGMFDEDFAISVAKQNISHVIENEVFFSLSKELRNFLVKLSLIDNLPSELLMDLASYNTGLLSEMKQVSSFIRYDAFMKTYRIHHLFLTFLQERQRTLKQEDKIEIYNKSADWFAKNGYSIDALTYYEKAGNYDRLLETALPFYAFGTTESALFILDILNRLPERIYEEKPFTRVIHAKFTLNSYRFDEACAEATRIIGKYKSMPLTEETGIIIGESYIILCVVSLVRCAYTGEYDFEEYFKSADEYLPNGSTLLNKDNYPLNTGNYCCPVGLPVKGEFDRFIDALFNSMPYIARVLNGSGLGNEYLCLAEKSYLQMEMKNTIKYASKAISESQKVEQYCTECLAIYFMVKANFSLGNYSKIMSLLEQMKAVCEKYNSSKSYALLDITEGWFYSQIKQPDRIAEWISKEMGSLNKATTPVDYMLGRLIRARCYLAEQKYQELMAFLDEHEELYGPSIFLLGRIEKKVMKAVVLYQVKETEEALAVLKEAYDLAAPDSLFMPFIEMGSKMRTLVNVAKKNKSNDFPKQCLEMICRKSSSYAKRVSNIITEYRISNHLENDIRSSLTQRELDLLTDICHGLSREEIASDLDLSVNTVKGMLQIVFEKLGAENTIDAVRIAISLNLVK